MKKTREITVDGKRYLWRFHPTYRKTGDPLNPYVCHDRFSAWLEGYARAPFRLLCVTWEDSMIGGPLRVGAPLLLSEADSPVMNLNHPKWAAAIIRAAGEAGWRPEAQAKPFEVTDGIGFLKQVWDATARETTDQESR